MSKIATQTKYLEGLKKSGKKSSKSNKMKKRKSVFHSMMVKGSSLRDLSPVKLSVDSILLEQCKLVSNLRNMVEFKEPIPSFKGRDAPNSLTIPHSGYQYTDTKESLILTNVMRGLFRDKIYGFRLSTALNMSSSSSGIVNSVINVDVVRSSPDFSAISSIFQEFFVKKVEAKWIPNSRYQYPLSGTSTLSIANLPIGCAQLQHYAAAYTSLGALANNYDAKYHSTGDPFTYSWVNVEKSSEGTLPVTSVTQSWCDTGGSQTYGGSVQFLSQSAPPALPFSQVLGTFMVHWDLLFRVRE